MSARLMDHPAVASQSDFPVQLQAALAETESRARLDSLARLARSRLSFIETIKLDQALIFNAAVIQQSCLDVREPLFGSYDRLVPAAPSRLIARLNDLLAHAAAQENVMLLDLAQASARDGIAAWFDIGRWLQGKMEIAPQAAPA